MKQKSLWDRIEDWGYTFTLISFPLTFMVLLFGGLIEWVNQDQSVRDRATLNAGGDVVHHRVKLVVGGVVVQTWNCREYWVYDGNRYEIFLPGNNSGSPSVTVTPPLDGTIIAEAVRY